MANQNSMAIAPMNFSILYWLLRLFRPLWKPTIEVKSSENIALLLVFVHICWLVKLNPTLSNIIMAIANVAIVEKNRALIAIIAAQPPRPGTEAASEKLRVAKAKL
jgi:hypothetical protein